MDLSTSTWFWANNRPPFRNNRIASICVIFIVAGVYMIDFNSFLGTDSEGSIGSRTRNQEKIVKRIKSVAHSIPSDANLFIEETAYLRNSLAMKQQREHLETLCLENGRRSWLLPKDGKTTITLEYIKEAFAVTLNPPARDKIIASSNTPIQPCNRVFWDLGANIGDTLIDVIEAGFHDLSCHPDSIPALNINSGRITDAKKNANNDHTWRGAMLRHNALRHSEWNSLGDWTAHMMKESSSQTHIEDYCYFGLEVRN